MFVDYASDVKDRDDGFCGPLVEPLVRLVGRGTIWPARGQIRAKSSSTRAPDGALGAVAAPKAQPPVS